MNQPTVHPPAHVLAKHLRSENFRSRALAAAPRGTATNVDRLTELAIEAVRLTPDLQQADPKDICRQVLKVATLGLPIGPDGAYLVPYRNRKRGTVDVQLQLAYRGLITLALRSGHVAGVSCGAIHEGDQIDYQTGSAGFVNHRPALKSRGELIGAWAIASFTDPAAPDVIEVIGQDEIDKARSLSAGGGKSGPWKDHPGAMARKTALRRLFNYTPASVDQLTEALAVEDEQARGWDSARDVTAPVPAIEDQPEAAPDYQTGPPTFEQCADGIRGAGSIADAFAWCNTAAGAGLAQHELEGLRTVLQETFPDAERAL